MPFEVPIIRTNWTSLRVGRFTPLHRPIISDNGRLVGHYHLCILPHSTLLLQNSTFTKLFPTLLLQNSTFQSSTFPILKFYNTLPYFTLTLIFLALLLRYSTSNALPALVYFTQRSTPLLWNSTWTEPLPTRVESPVSMFHAVSWLRGILYVAKRKREGVI